MRNPNKQTNAKVKHDLLGRGNKRTQMLCIHNSKELLTVTY